MNNNIETVAVDLTPVLPGGENGGAKIFVIELLKCLASISPEIQFILLTAYYSHDELEILDRCNMRRLLVRKNIIVSNLNVYIRKIGASISQHLPIKWSALAQRMGYKIVKKLKRSCISKTLLHDIGADLLYCPFTAPTYFEIGIPTVCTIYDLQYKEYPEFFSNDEVANRELNFETACHHATVLAAISNFSRDTAIKYGKIDPNHIRTIYLRLARRIEASKTQDKNILKELGLCTKRYLVYPANFWKHKNHEMLLTAFGIACENGLPKDFKLVCTGNPGERQMWLIRAAKSMNIGERVLFPGYLRDTDLSVLIKESSGMVFPSLYEGFGMPVIEAMAAGVPVACSNSTSLPEIAESAAIFFDPGVPTQISDAILSLVNDELLRTKLIKSGKTRAIEFLDVNIMAKEYLELFQFALTMKNQINMMTGVFVDGWAGKKLYVQVEPSESAQTLEFELSAPDWLPQRQIAIQMNKTNNHKDCLLVLERGKSAKMSLPIKTSGECLEVLISPTFVPALIGHGDDERELSILINRCGIKRDNGEYVDLIRRNL